MDKDNDTRKKNTSKKTVKGTRGAEGEAESRDEKLVNMVRGETDGLRSSAKLPFEVVLDRTPKTEKTEDQALWVAIRNRSRDIAFDRYSEFIRSVLCDGDNKSDDYAIGKIERRREDLESRPTLYGVDSYHLLKIATEAFLIFNCGLIDRDGNIYDPKPSNDLIERNRVGRPVDQKDLVKELHTYIGSSKGQIGTLPYLDRIVKQIVGSTAETQEEKLPYCEAILRNRLSYPSLLELIWSYWHEQGALTQAMNVISLRFQNKRLRERDPLANMELDPLRPLNHILWGFIQDEHNRLSLQRRAYEYDHHYGLILIGKAVPHLQSADTRSNFIEAFHNLLHRTALFYREDDDATVLADAFALLNALREVHLILAEGAHNQYGDLPWTARREMLIMQWLLARPETKAFLRGRYMVPYQEPWMGAVDAMKRLQGWGDDTVTHFHELGVHGEQILLSIRLGDWIEVNDQEQARNWARYWRPEIQRYIHAYNAVTGVDLSADAADLRLAQNRFVQPAVLIDSRQLLQKRSTRVLPAHSAAKRLPSRAGRETSMEIGYSGRTLLSRRGD